MHELAASILLAVDLDSLDSDDRTDPIGATLAREYVEHDTFILYEALMKHAKPWYQWKEDSARGAKPNVSEIYLLPQWSGLLLLKLMKATLVVSASSSTHRNCLQQDIWNPTQS